MMYGWIIGLAFLVVLVIVLSRGNLFRGIDRGGRNTEITSGQSAKEILKSRYAKGEIDRSEFEEKMTELERNG